jgi:hypothetical protein
MKLPRANDRLNKKDLIDLLQKSINKANTDSSDGYYTLRRMCKKILFDDLMDIEYDAQTKIFRIV